MQHNEISNKKRPHTSQILIHITWAQGHGYNTQPPCDALFHPPKLILKEMNANTEGDDIIAR